MYDVKTDCSIARRFGHVSKLPTSNEHAKMKNPRICCQADSILRAQNQLLNERRYVSELEYKIDEILDKFCRKIPIAQRVLALIRIIWTGNSDFEYQMRDLHRKMRAFAESVAGEIVAVEALGCTLPGLSLQLIGWLRCRESGQRVCLT